ncbi:AI-2E family transporter [Halobacteriales archaeon QS_8_65_32]|jgi:predicted PurR-regulated permease PerM|nr:MAG: AI-2E family transporter [Halobacteriales archaeon QS_8_65_32]
MNGERRFLFTLVLAFAAVSALFVLPYRQYVLLAVLLGYLLYPLQRRLAPQVGPRPAAGILIATATLVVLVPLGALLVVAARQAIGILGAVASGELGLDSVESFLGERTGIDADLGGTIAEAGVNPEELLGLVDRQSGTALLDFLLGLLGGVSTALIGLTVVLFLLYYFLVDGASLLVWSRDAAPLSADTWRALMGEIDRLMWAVLVGNLAVAVVQGILTGIGFLALGIDNVVFWTVVTVILALLPLIGASVIWIPASGYLLVVGRPVAAVALFAYGALVVSLSDNYLRPMVGGREANLNPALFVLGIFGGLVALGFMGLFFGPVIVGTLKVLVELATDERRTTGFAG